MKPILDAGDVRRFIEPTTSHRVLFPYAINAGQARLLSRDQMEKCFPLALKYLEQFEPELRRINKTKAVASDWYRYTYPKNLVRQQKPKIVVAQLVPDLRLSFDEEGSKYLDNVRVNGILPRGDNGWFLLGVLNAPVTNYIFKWLAKPKDNGFYEANKQFIAPLPVPRAGPAERAGLSALARRMQELRTAQVADEAGLEERLAAAARADLPLERMLPGVRGIEAIAAAKPKSVDARAAKRWVDDERAGDEEAALARIDALIRPDSLFAVTLSGGKLAFAVDEQEVARLFVAEADAALIEAQWRAVAIAFRPSGKDDARRLVGRLRRVATGVDAALAAQIVAIGAELAARDVLIREDERQLHEMTCTMFRLTPAERRLVERGRV